MDCGSGDDGLYLVDRAWSWSRWQAGFFKRQSQLWRRRVGAGIKGKEKAGKRSHASAAHLRAAVVIPPGDKTSLIAVFFFLKYNAEG